MAESLGPFVLGWTDRVAFDLGHPQRWLVLTTQDAAERTDRPHVAGADAPDGT